MRRLLCAGAIGMVVVLGLPGGGVAQQSGVTVERVAGPNRFATAVAVAEAWIRDTCAEAAANPSRPYGSEEQCLQDLPISANFVRGDSFADALAVPTFAGSHVEPTILTPPDRLPPELDRLAPHLNHPASLRTIFGSTDVVGQDVEDEIRDRYGEVSRVAGPNRFATAASAAQANLMSYLAQYDSGSVPGFFLVNGENWPDALSASSLVSLGRPVLLVRRDEIPESAMEIIQEFGSSSAEVFIVGGEAVVSQAVVEQLASLPVGPIHRIAGPDRTATARAIAEDFLQTSDPPGDDVSTGIILVRPDSFADAIAAPALIQSRRAPIILPSSVTDLGEANIQWLKDNGDRLDTVTVLGDIGVVPDSVVQQAVDAICEGRNDCG